MMSQGTCLLRQGSRISLNKVNLIRNPRQHAVQQGTNAFNCRVIATNSVHRLFGSNARISGRYSPSSTVYNIRQGLSTRAQVEESNDVNNQAVGLNEDPYDDDDFDVDGIFKKSTNKEEREDRDDLFRRFDNYKIDELGRTYGTGRRKTSVARVWLSAGSGCFTVNGKDFSDYFRTDLRSDILKPFLVTDTTGLYDVYCTVKGGGTTGQAGAVRLGVAKALENMVPGSRFLLKPDGLLTRDDRRVERKKPGQKKARKKFQWVKR